MGSHEHVRIYLMFGFTGIYPIKYLYSVNDASNGYMIWGKGGGILGDFRELQEISGDFRRFNRIWGILERITPPADHGVTYPESCPEEWFLRGCCGVWHARAMQVSVCWQLAEEVPVDPLGSWSCSAPSFWSCASSSSRRYREVSPCTWF